MKGNERNSMRPRNIRIIDADAIRQNMVLLRGAVPRSAEIMAVVKADGYGHGAVTAARAALSGGASALAVATAEEGIELRQAGITAPILVLGAADREGAEAAARSDLTMTVCSPEMVRLCQSAAEQAAARKGKPETVKVHLKVDSGMGRLGVRSLTERESVLEAISECRLVQLTGAYTHFSDADGNAEGEIYSEEQFRRFLTLTEGLRVPRHCANSAAALRHPEWALDMVREGISLYGYPPVETGLGLKPCMEWRAKISYVKEVPPGEYISYGRTFRTDRQTRIATITCGYGDGYHRSAGGQAEVLIRGRRARILGRICMDQMMADVTEIPEAKEEDPVILLGEDGGERISAEDLARWSGTISYEILLSSGKRVIRTEKTKAAENAGQRICTGVRKEPTDKTE